MEAHDGRNRLDVYCSFQPDIRQALRKLQQQIFAEGRYFKVWEHLPGGIAPPTLLPQTIAEVRAYSGLTGTHSILDIDAEGRLEPFPPETLQFLFGTDGPTRPIIDQLAKQKLFANDPCIGYEFGDYIIISKAERPDELLFCGATGD
jgi:hypothetical protein